MSKHPEIFLVLRRAVEQSCCPPAAGRRLPTFFLIIPGHYYQQDILLKQKKKREELDLSPLSCSSSQQPWSAGEECPSWAGSKCKFSKEHLANVTTGSMPSGLSDFPLLQENPHENEILNWFYSCMAGRGAWLAGSGITITQVWFTCMPGCAAPEKLHYQGQLIRLLSLECCWLPAQVCSLSPRPWPGLCPCPRHCRAQLHPHHIPPRAGSTQIPRWAPCTAAQAV